MRRKIGEVLIEAGLITTEQLETALVFQKGKNKKIGKVLVELKYINEVQLAEVLSTQLCLPLVDCDKITIPEKILDLISNEVAKKYLVLPLDLKDTTLLVVMANPLDWESIDDLRFRTGYKISIAVTTESSLIGAIEKYYGAKEQSWEFLNEIPQYEGAEIVKGMTGQDEQNFNVQSLFKLSEAPPIVKLVTMILVDAVKARASDIHIEPREKYVQVRYRIDGDLRNVLQYPKHLQDSVISRIKIISNLDITNRRSPQDGRSALKIENRIIDLRVSSLPSVFGENIVIRLLDQSTGLISLTHLGVPEQILLPLIKLATQPQGMILVTGPTGSGKTTTIYALLQQLLTETESIFSIEDPVEYKIAGVTQVAVNEAVGLTFAKALRSILRQDPDIIMLGEIRDVETAEIAVRSALTGHLVLSTIHTNDTVATITRLLDIGLDDYLVSSAVSGILAQRLVKKICPKCKAISERPEITASTELPPLKTYFKGKGCKHCNNSGYRGQVGIYEFLLMDTRVRRLLAKNAPEDDIWDAAREAGTKSLFENAWEKVKDGTTTVEEVVMKIPHKNISTSIKT